MEARPRLLDEVRDQLPTLHYSYRTQRQYLFWVRRFLLFHGKRHPADMAAAELEAFLTHQAVDRQVSASTQNQALAALLFLYKKVLHVELPWLDGIVRATLSWHLPVVLTPGEATSVLSQVPGEYWLIASLLSTQPSLDTSASSCRMRSSASIRTHSSSRAGSTCSRPSGRRATRGRAHGAFAADVRLRLGRRGGGR